MHCDASESIGRRQHSQQIPQALLTQWNYRAGLTFHVPDFGKISNLGNKMIYHLTTAVFVGFLIAGSAAAQTAAPSGTKPETSCTTTGTATSGSGEEKTSNSMAVEKSAILPEAGGANSAAPTVQSGGKPLEVRPDCPPDTKGK
jgi:hypothetical protein